MAYFYTSTDLESLIDVDFFIIVVKYIKVYDHTNMSIYVESLMNRKKNYIIFPH